MSKNFRLSEKVDLIKENHETTVLGIDVGGTKTCLAIVDSRGKIIESCKTSTNKSSCVSEFVENMMEILQQFQYSIMDVEGIGIGIRGLVSYKKRRLISSSIFGGAIDRDLRREIEVAIGKPTYIENDVKAATIAESLFGHGKNTSDFVFLNIGTGIGMGAFANGKIIRGYGNYAGEISNYIPNILLDSLQQKNLESFVSGEALSCSNIDRAKVNDDFISGLIGLINNIVCMLNPELIVLGGGVMSNADILTRLDQQLNEEREKIPTWMHVPILITNLGVETVGVLGAASLVFSNII